MKRNVQSAILIFGCCAALLLAGQGKGGGQGRRTGGPPSGAPQSRGQGQESHGANPAKSAGQGTQRYGQSAVEHLQRHPEQAARVQQMLPPGTDMNSAAGGFKNFGQFVSAVQVSKNLNIPFDQLKMKTTGPDAKPLGDAIHELRPDLSRDQVKAAIKAARQEEKQIRKQSRSEQRGKKSPTKS
jgi:hypothetical protein